MDPFALDIPAGWFVRPDGFDGSTGIHGVGHTRRVLVHACEIAGELGLCAWECEALELAACWHDIGRTHDGADHYHGAKSAVKVVGLGLQAGIEPAVLEVALFAVTHHCGDEAHAEQGTHWTINPAATRRVFRVLKDADGLDRVRLGDLDPAMLRHDISRERIDRAWELLHEVR